MSHPLTGRLGQPVLASKMLSGLKAGAPRGRSQINLEVAR